MENLYKNSTDLEMLRLKLMGYLALGICEFGPVFVIVYEFIIEGFVPFAIMNWVGVSFVLGWGALGSFFFYTAVRQYWAQKKRIEKIEAARRQRE